MNYKRGFIETLGIIILGVALLVASGVTYYSTKHQKDTPFVAGSYNPTGGGTYRLQSSIGTSNTSITLTSFKEPVSNIPYTMSYLNSSIEYATIDPQTTYKEFISFSGITQNADGTATLTGVVRGLGFSYPYTASTTLAQAHSGQSILILSNPPQLTNQYPAKANDETISGLWTFTQTPLGINPGGQPNASETVIGVSELATQIEMASSTSLGSTAASLVLQAKYATSSPYATGLYIPITRNDGKLNPNFIATTSSDTYNFGGSVNLLNQTNVIASSTQYTLNVGSVNATSTVRATSFVGNGSALTNIATPRYTYASTSIATTTAAIAASNGSKISYASTTPTNITIPAGILTASSTISVKVNGTCTNGLMTGNGNGSCYILLRKSTGETIWEGGVGGATLGNYGLNVDTVGLNSASSQVSVGTCSTYIASGVSCSAINSTSAVDFTQSLGLVLVIRATVSAGPGDTGTISSAGITNYSIIVNP